MATTTISLLPEQLEQLKAVANRLNVTPEELIRASVEELLAGPEEDFRKALTYVLDKNTELYKRLD